MFISIIIFLVPFMTVAFLPLAIRTLSSDELEEMGVRLEGAEMRSSCPSFRESDHILPKATLICGNA